MAIGFRRNDCESGKNHAERSKGDGSRSQRDDLWCQQQDFHWQNFDRSFKICQGLCKVGPNNIYERPQTAICWSDSTEPTVRNSWTSLSFGTRLGSTTRHQNWKNNLIGGNIQSRRSRTSSNKYCLPAKWWDRKGPILYEFLVVGTTTNADSYD